MPEKFIERGIEAKLEKEKMPESIITAYVIRHGETTTEKLDPRRGLTERGIEQAKKAALRIANEIAQETPKEQKIELRGYDSGIDRANQTLIEVVKVLTEKGYKVYLPYSSQEIAQDKVTLEEMKKAGLIYGEGPGIKPRIRNMTLPTEAKKRLTEEAERKGEELVVTILTTPPEKLKEMGGETPKEIFQRMESGVKSTNRVSQWLRKREYPRKIVAIATSHGGTLEGYLTEKLGIGPKELGAISNCEGFRLDFTGKPGEEPKINFWGEEIEKRMTKK